MASYLKTESQLAIYLNMAAATACGGHLNISNNNNRLAKTA